MIDIEKELTDIVERLAIPWEEHDGELMTALTTLCRRAVAETWEDAAKVCDEVAAQLVAENPGEQGQDEAGGAKACADAIRSRKETQRAGGPRHD